MEEIFSRSEALLGSDTMNALSSKRVILFGVGGVGSWCAEALIRTGLMHLTIVDGDVVQPSNINRQLPATQHTLNHPKVYALRERLLSINPNAEVIAVYANYAAEGKTDKGEDLYLASYDFLIDAIDSVAAKTDLLLFASHLRGIKIFSSMGAALRLNPTAVTTGELMTVQGDALAKAVRARMKRLGLKTYKKVHCVYSKEQAHRCEGRGSLMQVTAVYGCTLASMVVQALR